MKKSQNNTYLKAFIDSSLFLPFLLFCILSITNNWLFFQKTFVNYNWRFLYAFWGGCCHDLFIFSLISIILVFVSKRFPILKKLSILFIHFMLILPILDYLYFRATLERFNWVVLKYINFYSAKGYIGNLSEEWFYIITGLAILILSLCFSNKKKNLLNSLFYKTFVSFCIFTLFSSLFSNNIMFNKETNFYGHIKNIEGKNHILKNLSFGSILGFLLNTNKSLENTSFINYTDQEKEFLEKHRIIIQHSDSPIKPAFDSVIMIVLESFALEYIHAVNSDIPYEASPFFDYLINNYPHSNSFYTSDFPTLQGQNAILSSKIPFIENSILKQKYNIVSIFKKENNNSNSNYYINGSSKFYGNEINILKNKFCFSNIIGYEDLAEYYPEPSGYVWGYQDHIVFDKTISVLRELKNTNYFVLIKLLNQHQPIFQFIKNAPQQPLSVLNHKSDIVKAIYDADKLLKDFIESLKTNNLINDRTLIVITSDHYPPLGYGHTELIKSDFHSQLGKLPLIFITNQKEIFINLKEDSICCQLDIAPTLCYLLGFDIPKEYMGQNILSKNYRPRTLGIMNNETIYYQSKELAFKENLINPATSTTSIRKWINNLWVETSNNKL